MTKVIAIIENNHITGVKYGTVEVADNTSTIETAKSAYDSARAKIQSARTKKIRGERTKNK
ncbi:MAG: hypothetical protein J6Q44_00390 [Alphaproteobacteria bacterium]|nr:hypothetical protein [Alphaproteobacteria bacterium]